MSLWVRSIGNWEDSTTCRDFDSRPVPLFGSLLAGRLPVIETKQAAEPFPTNDATGPGHVLLFTVDQKTLTTPWRALWSLPMEGDVKKHDHRPPGDAPKFGLVPPAVSRS
jgi:hypothetical protein